MHLRVNFLLNVCTDRIDRWVRLPYHFLNCFPCDGFYCVIQKGFNLKLNFQHSLYEDCQIVSFEHAPVQVGLSFKDAEKNWKTGCRGVIKYKSDKIPYLLTTGEPANSRTAIFERYDKFLNCGFSMKSSQLFSDCIVWDFLASCFCLFPNYRPPLADSGHFPELLYALILI